MTAPVRRRAPTRIALADRSLEALPLFRLSDSATGDDRGITFMTPAGGRWRVLPSPGDRLPGTFDQDVYVELLHRYHESGAPADGVITFTLHAFLRAMGRRVDGRTYEQLRGALMRLERTTLESTGSYYVAASNSFGDIQFSLLTSVIIERRRAADADQLGLFPALAAGEPGVGRATLSPVIRENIAAGHSSALSMPAYLDLPSPVARRIYRLLAVAKAEGRTSLELPLDRLAEQLPLVQRYPSHIARVLQPAHAMLEAAGAATLAEVRQERSQWIAAYAF